ncbi:hypothetical protein AVEN_142039-1 [Araneus ventricosus]|uniref:Uncharacterized protein n=1 Tax=Araneus ventricosus TaxID=182803 RepID=A0A4Y2LVW7_ARAVE|nr:hypothetical protein AVEN_142039-1 [Araneus ventricosus]
MSNAAKGRTTKFMPKKDGPYIILTQKAPTSYVIANPDNPNEPVGTYHPSELKVYKQGESATLVHPLRKRGRPRKTYTSGSSPRRSVGVCDNHILSRPLTKRWRCKDLSLPKKDDRQSLDFSCEKDGFFPLNGIR